MARIALYLRRTLLFALGVLALYVLLLLHPEPLFAYEVRADNVVLHSRAPLPPRASAIARAVLERVGSSPFYSSTDTYDVYLCDTPRLFSFVSPLHPRAGGVSQVYLTGNAFVRPSRIEQDRLIGPGGNEVPGERTLTYFIAHEVTHTMVARRLGRFAYHSLAAWQQEGYADHVGKAPGDFDYDAALAAFRADQPELDPARSGLYLRYQLFTEYSLRQLGQSPEELLAIHRPRGPLEDALREDTAHD
jgi:hypothetical protein